MAEAPEEEGSPPLELSSAQEDSSGPLAVEAETRASKSQSTSQRGFSKGKTTTLTQKKRVWMKKWLVRYRISPLATTIRQLPRVYALKRPENTMMAKETTGNPRATQMRISI
jgi:hypothetical protein